MAVLCFTDPDVNHTACGNILTTVLHTMREDNFGGHMQHYTTIFNSKATYVTHIPHAVRTLVKYIPMLYTVGLLVDC